MFLFSGDSNEEVFQKFMLFADMVSAAGDHVSEDNLFRTEEVNTVRDIQNECDRIVSDHKSCSNPESGENPQNWKMEKQYGLMKNSLRDDVGEIMPCLIKVVSPY